jgi:Carboxypeptidase regulatory-like domain
MRRALSDRMRWTGRALIAVVALPGVGAIARTAAASREPCRASASASMSWATAVDGVVVDHEGHAIAGALVVARPAAEHTQRPDPLAGGVVTDRDGRFHMNGLVPGEYWFVAIHGGLPFGTTPAMPVDDRLRVSIALTAQATPM